MRYLPFFALMSFLFAGCSTTNIGGESTSSTTTNAVDSVKAALPYIAPAVTLACTVVLEQALSPEDRIEKAKMINHVASIIESLTRGSTPTPDELRNALSDYLPQEKTHWVVYVNSVKDIYAAQFNRLDGNGKLAVDILNAIAKGCKDATASYFNN
jgi:Iap family predicted aminopeptidase